MASARYQSHITALANLPARAAALVQQHRTLRAAAEQRYDLAGETKRAMREAVRRDASRALDELREDYQQAAGALRDELRRARHGHPKMGVDEQLAWERLRGTLDTLPQSAYLPDAAMERLRLAQAEGDDAMLRVARRMLPDYLATKGEQMSQPERDQLDILGGGESVREAVELERDTARRLLWVEGALNASQGDIDGTEAGVLPTWEGSVIQLGEAPDYQRLDYSAKQRAAGILREAGVLQEIETAQAAERAERIS